MTPGSQRLGEIPSFLRGDIITPAYLWVTGRKGWPALALAAGLGVITNLAFPPIWFWPAMAIGLSGLIWIIDGAKLRPNPGRSFMLRVGAFFFGQYLVGFHWVAAAFLVNPGAHLAFIWMAVVLLPGGRAVLMAAMMRIAFIFWVPGPARLVVFTVGFTLAEWVRGHLFGGFPWNLPGMIWEPGGAISQSLSLWGVYGLSALSVLAMASLGALADARPRGQTASRAGPVLLSAIVFGSLWGWGEHRLATPLTGPAGPLVRLVDTGAPQAAKDDEANLGIISQRFRLLSGADEPGAAPIVIWPEGALPTWLFANPDEFDRVTEWMGHRRLIIGVTRAERVAGANGKSEVRAYNSLAVLSSEMPERRPIVYDKHMLVPFGEFTPLREYAAMIGIATLQELAKDGFYPGPKPTTISNAPGVPPFGPLICYEAIFPGLLSPGDERPRWLVNISNDSWFGHLSGPWQHDAQARFRAIEEGLPMARAAAGGITSMIDAYGRRAAQGQPADPLKYGQDPKGWRSSIVDAPVPQVAEPTPYSKWRDGLFWIILLSFNLGLLVLPRK